MQTQLLLGQSVKSDTFFGFPLYVLNFQHTIQLYRISQDSLENIEYLHATDFEISDLEFHFST